MQWLYNLSLLALVSVCVGGSIGFGTGSVLLIRRTGWVLKRPDRTPGIALYALSGIMYAVALGLLVTAVRERLR